MEKAFVRYFSNDKAAWCFSIFDDFALADLRWNKLMPIICKLHKEKLFNEDNEKKTCGGACRMLNSNIILVARTFLYRVRVFY